MLNQKQFAKYSGKFDSFEDIHKIPRNMKNKNIYDTELTTVIVEKYKNADVRLAYKNRRKINKDFKDFMNNQ